MDVSRFSAQVINGIGFLGAGTIIVTGHQEVKGLTTAAALWASACMGIVIGAGYYACVVIGFLLLMLCVGPLNWLEAQLIQRSRCINLYVEFDSVNEIWSISRCLREQGVHIYDIDLEGNKWGEEQHPSAILTLRMSDKGSHTQLIHKLFTMANVRRINEI